MPAAELPQLVPQLVMVAADKVCLTGTLSVQRHSDQVERRQDWLAQLHQAPLHMQQQSHSVESAPPEGVPGIEQAGKHGVVAAQAHRTRQLGHTARKANMQFVIAEDMIAAEDTDTLDAAHMDTPHSHPVPLYRPVPLDKPVGTVVQDTGTAVYMLPPAPLHTSATPHTLARHPHSQFQAAEVPVAGAEELPQAKVADP